MAANNETVSKMLTVSFLLCVVCSVMVSTAAVWLRPVQQKNRQLDIKKKLLLTTGLLNNPGAEEEEIEEAFKNVEVQVIDLASGKLASDISPEDFDPKKVESVTIDPQKDVAGIKRRPRYARVYRVKKDGRLDQLVFPVYGKGLWSTMYGFLALDSDLRTVRGFGHYEHGETPGLGGEVDNPAWKAQWRGKIALDENLTVILDVLKGKVIEGNANASSEVDGLSGATITANGVEATMKYWLGEDGFGPFLQRVRAGGGE